MASTTRIPTRGRRAKANSKLGRWPVLLLGVATLDCSEPAGTYDGYGLPPMSSGGSAGSSSSSGAGGSVSASMGGAATITTGASSDGSSRTDSSVPVSGADSTGASSGGNAGPGSSGTSAADDGAGSDSTGLGSSASEGAASTSSGGTSSSTGGATGSGGTSTVSSGPATFSQIATYLTGYCATSTACHGAGSREVVLTGAGTYDTLMGLDVARCTNQPMVAPGEPTASAFYNVLTDNCSNFRMPPSCPSNHCTGEENIQMIASWIMAGASND